MPAAAQQTQTDPPVARVGDVFPNGGSTLGRAVAATPKEVLA